MKVIWRHHSLLLPLGCSLQGRASTALGAVVVELTEWGTVGVVLCTWLQTAVKGYEELCVRSGLHCVCMIRCVRIVCCVTIHVLCSRHIARIQDSTCNVPLQPTCE